MTINLDRVTKNYKTRRSDKVSNVIALNNMSFSLNQSEMLGYIGFNGAGKSTTIKLLTGILIPSSGNIEVLGKNPYRYRKEIARNIGVVFGQRSQLIWDLPPIDTFNLFSKIYEVPVSDYKRALNYIVEYLDMSEIIVKPVRKLSLGQRMCCEVTAALLHSPHILFLDEPTIGLDIINKEKIRKLVKKMNEEKGTTIFLTSHDLKDIESLCNKVILIDSGEKIFEGSIEKIKSDYGKYGTIKFDFYYPKDCLSFTEDWLDCEKSIHDNSLTIRFDKSKYKASELINPVMERNISIKDINITEMDLESVIKEFYMSL